MATATFEDVKNIKPTSVLIDVRRPEELQETGVIPHSINIPLDQLEAALKMSNNDFKEKYGIDKPKTDQDVIFSCKLGGRAERAMKTATQLGYNSARYYKGSWTDWVANCNN